MAKDRYSTQQVAKPFLKWVGGKSQLINTIEMALPMRFFDQNDITYIEPFVGGGALLFRMLAKYKSITRAVINDINQDLIETYSTIKHNPRELIEWLESFESQYQELGSEELRKDYFLEKRSLYNTKPSDLTHKSALLMFLNRTCFNGLYRVNSKGEFNVPFGRYNNPTICDRATIIADSQLLQRVEIISGDFAKTDQYATSKTFYYIDPPYKPLTKSANFTSYSTEGFDDSEQERLKEFCDKISSNGACVMASNSDVMNSEGGDMFFDNLYRSYNINRVMANRMINSKATGIGKLTELLITNFDNETKDLFTTINNR